jgi:vacuolar protein sorting-associated protein IST1
MMDFFSKQACDYTKLKSNLRLCNNRLGLLKKKKTEINLKNRREIAELLKDGKIERGRIKTEHIVREDYVVEVMEILQTYCDLLLARFGIFEAKAEVDPALEAAIATLIWCVPRLSAEVNELNVIKQQFAAKYTKNYVDSCLENKLKKVNSAVIQKLDMISPSPSLIEMYMMEIARAYDVKYEPNLDLLNKGEDNGNDGGQKLIDFEPDEGSGLPQLPEGYGAPAQKWDHTGAPEKSVPYPENNPFPSSEPLPPAPEKPPVPTDPSGFYGFSSSSPPPYDATMFPTKDNTAPGASTINPPANNSKELGFPSDKPEDKPPAAGSDDQDFDDLERRFNQLTKKK